MTITSSKIRLVGEGLLASSSKGEGSLPLDLVKERVCRHYRLVGEGK